VTANRRRAGGAPIAIRSSHSGQTPYANDTTAVVNAAVDSLLPMWTWVDFCDEVEVGCMGAAEFSPVRKSGGPDHRRRAATTSWRAFESFGDSVGAYTISVYAPLRW
jgi:hypothetical protein